jgi:hypothetical protein
MVCVSLSNALVTHIMLVVAPESSQYVSITYHGDWTRDPNTTHLNVVYTRNFFNRVALECHDRSV